MVLEEEGLFQLDGTCRKPLKQNITINKVQVPMEVDTGAAVSIMSLNNKNRYLHDVEMKETNVVLKTYTGEIILVVGEMFVIVEYGKQL